MSKSLLTWGALVLASFSTIISHAAAGDRVFTSSYPPHPKVPSSYHSKVEDIKWVDCAKNVPLAWSEANNLKLKDRQWSKESLPLPDFLSCGRLDVPMDYSKPLSKDNKITIGFTKLVANTTDSKGLLFWNPGGPGTEAQSQAWNSALQRDPRFNLSSATDVFNDLYEYDMIFYDPRGTGDSHQFKCDEKLANNILDRILPNETYYNALRDQTKAFAESCVKLSEPKGIVGFVGTEDAVNDWESLRIALKHDKVSWLGVSYGTYYGAEYAYQFPDRMDRFVLDAVTAHGLADIDKVRMDLDSIKDLLERVDAWCMANSSCAFHSAKKGKIPEVFKHVSDIAPYEKDQELRDEFSLNVEGNVKFAAFTEFLADFAKSAEDGFKDDNDDSSDSSGSSSDGEDELAQKDLNSLSFQATVCKDEALDDPSFEGFMKIMKQTTGDDPDKFIYQSGNFKNKINCIGWPLPGRPKGRLPNKNPFMIVTSDFDYNTPTEMATFITQDSPKAVLVVRHGDDHGTFTLPGQPAQELEMDYLLTGNLPTATEETLVTVVSPGQKRPPIADPYAAPIGVEAGDSDPATTAPSDNGKTQDPKVEGKVLSSSKASEDHDDDDDDGIWHDTSKLHRLVIILAVLSGVLLIFFIITSVALVSSRRTFKQHLRSTGGTNDRAFDPHAPEFVQVHYPNDNGRSGLGGESAKGYYGVVGRDERGGWN